MWRTISTLWGWQSWKVERTWVLDKTWSFWLTMPGIFGIQMNFLCGSGQSSWNIHFLTGEGNMHGTLLCFWCWFPRLCLLEKRTIRNFVGGIPASCGLNEYLQSSYLKACPQGGGIGRCCGPLKVEAQLSASGSCCNPSYLGGWDLEDLGSRSA
jgi:hypothetical protein